MNYLMRYYKEFYNYKKRTLNNSNLDESIKNSIQKLEKGEFKSVDLKKLKGSEFERIKINKTDRILCTRVHVNGKNYINIYELILNHQYKKSKFLNGKRIDEEIDLIEVLPITQKDIPNIDKTDTFNVYNPTQNNKTIFLSPIQNEIVDMKPPLIIIGSAGSGKTTLSIEMTQVLEGKILYISLSKNLVEKSQEMCENCKNVEFLSFHDFLNSIEKQDKDEIDIVSFGKFANDYKIFKDVEKYYEEFRGVIGGVYNKKYLSLEEYIGEIGVKKSLFNQKDREENVYPKFLKYLDYLDKHNLYDSNLVCFELLNKLKKTYDYVVVDEIQDFTPMQTHFIRETLKKGVEHNFIFSGDAHQIVYSNSFSFTKLRDMLFETQMNSATTRYDKSIIKILKTNYRNSNAITDTANKLLKIKQLRFGSIDDESNHLIETDSKIKGKIYLYKDTQINIKKVEKETRKSKKYAIIVLNENIKNIVREHFKTELIFTVQEIKGLEYENIILYNFISNDRKIFDNICHHEAQKSSNKDMKIISIEDLKHKLGTAGAKDKENKDLELLKVYINSLYVSLTRAIITVHIFENDIEHRLIKLLELQEENDVKLSVEASTTQEWQEEIKRLYKSGNKRQAEAIEKRLEFELQKAEKTKKLKNKIKKFIRKPTLKKYNKLESVQLQETEKKILDIKAINKSRLKSEITLKTDNSDYLKLIDHVFNSKKVQRGKKATLFKKAQKKFDNQIIIKLAKEGDYKPAKIYLNEKKRKSSYKNKYILKTLGTTLVVGMIFLLVQLYNKNMKLLNQAIDDENATQLQKIIVGNYLFDLDGEINKKTMLMTSVENNNVELVKILVENGASVNIVDKYKVTPLLYASSKGYLDIVKVLLAHNADVNYMGSEKATALFMASQGGFLKIVKLLLDNNAEIDTQGKENMTELFIASQNGYLEIVKLLLSRKANVNPRGIGGRTALIQASVGNNIETMQLLLADNRIKINLSDDENVSALLASSSSEGIKLLVNNGADVNAISNIGETILHRAIQNKNNDIIEFLLQRVDDVNQRRFDGYTPLFIASQVSNIETIKLLVKYGANIYDTVDGLNMLSFAVSNNYEVVEYFVNKGVDINTKNKDGLTPFLNSLNPNRDEKISLFLLKNGADINYTNYKDKSTPLMLAISYGYLKTAKLLIEKGANLEIKNTQGYTALAIAKKHKYHTIIELLQKAIDDK